MCACGSCVIFLFKKNEVAEKEGEEDVVVKKMLETSGTCKAAVRWDSTTTISALHK